MGAWQLLGVILASAVFWMQYVQLKDARQPEPRKHLLMAFGLGLLAWDSPFYAPLQWMRWACRTSSSGNDLGLLFIAS